jgi:hypothetical protein
MHSFNLQRVLLCDIELHDENAARQLAEMQITMCARRPDLCPANQHRKDLCNLHICARAGANTKIYVFVALSHTKPLSTAAERRL